ncbi:hypothetical protein D3C73_1611890 [compost metagenome]
MNESPANRPQSVRIGRFQAQHHRPHENPSALKNLQTKARWDAKPASFLEWIARLQLFSCGISNCMNTRS